MHIIIPSSSPRLSTASQFCVTPDQPTFLVNQVPMKRPVAPSPSIERLTRRKRSASPISYTLPTPGSDDVAPFLLCSPVFADLPRFTTLTLTSCEMKRSPGMANLNLFTKEAFAEAVVAEEHRARTRSGEPWTPKSSYHSRSFGGSCSSPELPASPDSPDMSSGSELGLSSSDEEDDFDLDDDIRFHTPIVAARRVLGGLHRGKLVSTPPKICQVKSSDEWSTTGMGLEQESDRQSYGLGFGL